METSLVAWDRAIRHGTHIKKYLKYLSFCQEKLKQFVEYFINMFMHHSYILNRISSK